MGYSRTLNSLKTVIAVATAFNIAACLVPETKQAAFAQQVTVPQPDPQPAPPAIGIGKFSGNAIVNAPNNFTFDLEDVQDQAPNDDNVGVFPGAIQNFNFSFQPTRGEVTRNSSVCGQEVCPPGTLTVTKFSLDSGDNIPGINLNNIPAGPQRYGALNGLYLYSSNVDFSKDVLRYDVNFGTSSAPELIWFIQSNDSSLINDLSALIKVDPNKTVGLYAILGPNVRYESFTFSNISGQFTSQQVPEPSITPALLGLAVLGSVSLLKRNKRFLKTVTQNSSSLSQKST
jgi:hypothetical protein